MTKILQGNINKRAREKVEYTKEMLEQLKMCVPSENEDAHLYFMTNFGYLKHPKHGKMPYKPYDYQIDLVNNYHNHRFSINMLARQLGKCVTGDTMIIIRDKETLETQEISIEEFLNKHR